MNYKIFRGMSMISQPVLAFCMILLLSTIATTSTKVQAAGSCGSAKGGSFSSEPATPSLCSSGTASGMTLSGSTWTWYCDTQVCTATKLSASSNNSSKTTAGLANPLANIDTFPAFIKNILNIVLTIGIPIVTFFIILSGFQFVAARGNPEELTKAKKSFMYTVIGAAVLLGAWVIASAISGTIDALTTN